MDTRGVIAIIGGIALFIGLIGGGITIKDAVIPPIPRLLRIISSVAGILILGISIWSIIPQPPNQTPAPIAPTVLLGAEANGRGTAVAEIQPTIASLQTQVAVPTLVPITTVVTVTQPISNLVDKPYIDNFQNERPDTADVKATRGLSLTTKISGGLLIAEVDSPYSERLYDTNEVFNDFDATIKFASIETPDRGNLSLQFKQHTDKWNELQGYNFQMLFDKNKVTVFYGDSFTTKSYFRVFDQRVVTEEVRSIRIVCKQDRCDFYANNNRLLSDAGFYDGSGTIYINVSGKASVRIEEVIITPL